MAISGSKKRKVEKNPEVESKLKRSKKEKVAEKNQDKVVEKNQENVKSKIIMKKSSTKKSSKKSGFVEKNQNDLESKMVIKKSSKKKSKFVVKNQIVEEEATKKGVMKKSSTNKKTSSKKSSKIRPKNHQKDPRQILETISKSNYFISLENFPQNDDGDDDKQVETAVGKILKLLQKALEAMTEEDFVTHKEMIEAEDGVILNLGINLLMPSNHEKAVAESKGVIIGPNTETEMAQIGAFYHLWGKKNCNLRRFQDGSTHETIALNNPLGLAYLPLAKIKHVLGLHFPQIRLKIHHLNEDYLIQSLRCSEQLIQTRSSVDQFCSIIRDACGSAQTEILPLRKIEALCSCLYKGDLS
jgi:hypothetical protein